MGYVSIKGGLDAIRHAERLARRVLGPHPNALTACQVEEQLELAVDQVMAEGSLYDAELAALAIKQAEGDLIEASVFLRAYRSTLPRLGYSLAAVGDQMRVLRRISATYKDMPGGQLLGRTRDYAVRLLDFSLLNGSVTRLPDDLEPRVSGSRPRHFPVLIDFLRQEGLLAGVPADSPDDEPFDVTRHPLRYPAPRSARLQVLSRGESGALLMLAYSALRGYGSGHPYVGELRGGELPVHIAHPLTGRPARIGWLRVSEAHMIFPGKSGLKNGTPEISLGYGVTVGRNERRAISMGVIDENLTRAASPPAAPIQDQEFVLSHVDGIESTGFVEHLKLPHYVTFQSQLQRSRRLQELMKAARDAG